MDVSEMGIMGTTLSALKTLIKEQSNNYTVVIYKSGCSMLPLVCVVSPVEDTCNITANNYRSFSTKQTRFPSPATHKA